MAGSKKFLSFSFFFLFVISLPVGWGPPKDEVIEDTKEAESEQWTDAVENQTEPPGTKNNKPKDISPLIYLKRHMFFGCKNVQIVLTLSFLQL